jgi:16S rRNA A1518/A1519 N6-dimethyltransferase RsmA/KsgA/DIM1 with predicted DNA glycosylase/AP lyase activity
MWSIGNFKNRVPFVTSSSAILKDIGRAMEIKDDSIVYDLGCGDGRILFYLSILNSKSKYIGIENGSFPFLLSKIGSYLNKKKTNNNVQVIRKDFFKHDLSNATNIFTYLYPNVMDDLLLKFDKELKPGTRLVSLSFKFTNKSPLFEVDLDRSKYRLGRKLFVYQF